MNRTSANRAVLGVLVALGLNASAMAGGDEFPPFDGVVKGLTKVVSTADGEAALYDLYQDRKKAKLLAVLPAGYDKKLQMIACTISGGDPESGVMGPTHYAKWRRIGKQVVLIEPNLAVRTEGDAQAKASVKHLYTDRVIVATPIVAMAPGNRPVIDLGSLVLTKAGIFFGNSIFGPYGASLAGLNPTLATITKTKAFPKNIIFEFEAPRGDGRLVRMTFAISGLEGTSGYKPRKADPRVGYFYDWHQDFARGAFADVTDRYISRWNLQKADPSLKVSPPKDPIVWYIEHTTPVRYRRYVRDGIQMWNQAFSKIGYDNAVVVYQQDAATGAHMEKDPEDARYNFFRWNVSNLGYAIGPSRTNPYTGEILDADVVWHQGLTRALRGMLENLSEDLVNQTFDAESLAWLDTHPLWDPRVRLQLAGLEKRSVRRSDDAERTSDDPYSRFADPRHAACRMSNLLAMEFSLVDAALGAGMLGADGEDVEVLDGLPEPYISAMIRYIAAHEVGHCMGLQHNMAASTIRSLETINSPGYDGPTTGSVMDYCAANINHELGELQGSYATPELGPYDKWAIAYGYGPDDKLESVLAGVSEPDHIFVSQLAMAVGSDPRNMTWDLGADNLQFAESRISLARTLREKLLTDVIKDGDSWKKARDRLIALLGTQVQSMFIAANWIGGSFINNDFKGDPGNRAPAEDVPAAAQRRALELIIANGFEDEAWGLSPELIRHLGREYWWDPEGMSALQQDPSFNVHDVVGSLQAITLTLVMNPARLRRVYDNEYRADGAPDQLTLAEVVNTVSESVWRELIEGNGREASADRPFVSSFRRNLQREHVDRLVDLALLQGTPSPALRTISSIATHELRRIDELAEATQKNSLDPYTAAHLADIRSRVDRALTAVYVLPR